MKFVLVATALTLLATLTSQLASGELAVESPQETCASRTGVTKQDVTSYVNQNGCSLECIAIGKHYKFWVNEGATCHEHGDWKCMRGRCLQKVERELEKKVDYPEYDLTLSILAANVPDEDKNPFNGESDVMILASVSDADDAYVPNSLIGHTPTIQDSNKPEWRDEEGAPLSMRPNPLPLGAKIRLDVYDSDKPHKPDYLGYVTLPVSRFLSDNREFVTLREPLIRNNLRSKYYVDVKGKLSKLSTEKAL